MNVMQQLLTDHIGIWTAAEAEKKSGSGRASRSAGSVYGIKKLRELILELAVRGKLVSQDVNDEPASALIKRMQAEKNKLAAEGKIKNENLASVIIDAEKLFELPHGWEWIRLGQVVEVLDSLRKPVTKQDRETGPYPYYGASGVVDYVSNYIFDEPLVLVGEDGAKWGRGESTAFLISGKTWVNNHAHVIRPYRSALIDNFVVCSLNAFDLGSFITGMTVPKLNQARLVSIAIPLPPLAEQHRIVAKVDELMALCDKLEAQHTNTAEAHEKLVSHLLSTLTLSQSAEDFSANWQRIAAHFDTLFTTECSIDALKQTLLQLAVMGKLVPHDANDDATRELSKRINSKNIDFSDEGNGREDEIFTSPDVEEPFAVFHTWRWCRFDCVWESSFYGPRFGKEEYVISGGIATIRTTDMTSDGLIELDSPPEVLVPKEKIDLYKIKYGDLLVTRSGSIGTMALFLLDMLAIPSAYLIRIRFLPILEPRYGLLYLRSPLGQQYLGLNSTSVGVPNVNATKMAAFPFPLPPLPEQHRIVAKVDELMELCDQLKSRIIDTRQLQQTLADVLVEHAVA